jgi:hypothetical protein
MLKLNQFISSPYLSLNNIKYIFIKIKKIINIILNNMKNKINNMRIMKTTIVKLSAIKIYLKIKFKHFIKLNLISLKLNYEYKINIKV